MLRRLTSDDIARLQGAVFDNGANWETRQRVTNMLQEHDMDSDALIAFLLTKVEERSLKPGSIAVLAAYGDADNREAEMERVKRAARERVRSRAAAKDKSERPRFAFGPLELLESPTQDYDLADKEYRTLGHFYASGSHIYPAMNRAATRWCSYEDFLYILKGNEKKLKAWGRELELFFSGRNRRYGWEGARQVEGGKTVIRIKPTPEWDGVTAPEGARTGGAEK